MWRKNYKPCKILLHFILAPVTPSPEGEIKPFVEIIHNNGFKVWQNAQHLMDKEEANLYFADTLKGHGFCFHSVKNFQECFLEAEVTTFS